MILPDYHLHFGCCSLGDKSKKSSTSKSLDWYNVSDMCHNDHEPDINRQYCERSEYKGKVDNDNINVRFLVSYDPQRGVVVKGQEGNVLLPVL